MSVSNLLTSRFSYSSIVSLETCFFFLGWLDYAYRRLNIP